MKIYRIEMLDRSDGLSDQLGITMHAMGFPAPNDIAKYKGGHNRDSLFYDNENANKIKFFFKKLEEARYYASGKAIEDALVEHFDYMCETGAAQMFDEYGAGAMLMELDYRGEGEVIYEDDVQIAIKFHEQPLMGLICL